MPAYAAVGPAASRLASSAARGPASSSGTTAVNSPAALARSASSGSASISNSAARAAPASRCSVQEAPESAPRPTRAKAMSRLARCAAILKSQASASDAPAPAALPLTAAITSLGMVMIVMMIGL
jgi:hypothetical protein